MKLLRKAKRLLRTFFWSTPMWARDGLFEDPFAAGEVLIERSWRYSAMVAAQQLAALAMQWGCYDKVRESEQPEIFYTIMMSAIFVGMAPMMGYLVRLSRLCIRLRTLSSGISASQFERAALIYLSPILLWLTGLLLTIHAVGRAASRWPS